MKLKVQGMEVRKFLCLLISLARNVKCLFTNKTRASSISPILYITEREARSFKLKLISEQDRMEVDFPFFLGSISIWGLT